MNPAFSVDPFLGKVHRGDSYNCLHFARDVWLAMTGEDFGLRMRALHAKASDRRVLAADLREFEKLDEPVSPCIALMRRPRTEPHMGIYLRRRILHLNERGAFFQPPHIAALVFQTVNYYR